MDSTAPRAVAAAFEAMVLVPMLRPLLPAGDAFGDYGLTLLASDVARRERGGFADALAAALERRP